ncbi:MAG: PAS domain S-box protein [Anaerolineaceae bacterium]|nr:PAS domain S-box protein [Anaerolineaceae bacterium]
MNDFSEIKNLTELVLTSDRVNLITDVHGHILEVYARELESENIVLVKSLVGKSLTDCSNLELVKDVIETIEIVNQSKQPAIKKISFSSKETWIQLEIDIFPITDQKFLIILNHHRSVADEIIPTANDFDLNNQVGIKSSAPLTASASQKTNFISKSNIENKSDSQFSKYTQDPNQSTISSVGEEIQGEPRIFLRSPEDQLINIITRVPLPIILVDELSLEIFFTNPLAIEYFEYEDDELSKLNLFDLFPSSENHYLSSVIRKDGVLSLEADYSWRLIAKRGTERTVRFLINQIDYENRKTLMVIILDQENDSKLNFIKEETNILDLFEKDLLVVRMTPDGIITQVNKNFADMIGRPLNKIVGRSFEENLFIEDYEGIFQHFAKLTPQYPMQKNINRMLTADGKTLWIEWTDRGIFEGDQLVEIYALGKNITDTYQRDLLQQSMEQRFQALVENLPMVVYVIHAKTFSPVYISPQVEKLTGYTPEEFYKSPEVWMNAMHPDDANIFYQLLQDRIEKNIAAPVEFRMYHKDGRLRWVEETGTTIKLPDGTILFQGVSRDVTGRHNAREKLIYYSNFERLVNEISLKLMNATPENLSEILQDTVDVLGKYMQVDRSYIFDFDYSDQTMSNTFEWCYEGISSQMKVLQKIPFLMFPWWIQKMEKNQEISLTTLDDLPPEEKDLKDMLSLQDICSLLVVPMFNNGKTSGFVGFDMVTQTRHWEKEVIQVLRLASAMITSTRERLEDLS